MFQRATVTRHDGSVKLEWVFDSAFRFYPVEPDAELGWRLHFADAATNKLLALSGRAEPRDFVDAIYLHENYLSLGTLAWAASGKDEGLNPRLILDLADRFARYRQADIDSLHLAAPLSLLDLKARWSIAIEEGRQLIEKSTGRRNRLPLSGSAHELCLSRPFPGTPVIWTILSVTTAP
jgi:hypothetical protein